MVKIENFFTRFIQPDKKPFHRSEKQWKKIQIKIDMYYTCLPYLFIITICIVESVELNTATAANA